MDRYRLWENCLQNGMDKQGNLIINNSRYPVVVFNKDNYKDGLLSMMLAKIKQGKNKFEKDKSVERSKIIPREQATDLSDAADTPLWGRYFSRLVSTSNTLVDVQLK